jgi:hypothetical protein
MNLLLRTVKNLIKTIDHQNQFIYISIHSVYLEKV